MTPIQSYATVLMAWKYYTFKENIKKYGFAYHGSDGKIGYYALKGLSTIDIDNEEDFELAEVALKHIENKQKNEVQYYEPKNNKKIREEKDVPKIMKKDGVCYNDFNHENLPLVNLN